MVRHCWRLGRTLSSVIAMAATFGIATGCTYTRSTTPSPVPNATSAPGTTASMDAAVPPGVRYVRAATPEAAGEYLTVLGGCNDCHTVGWAESNGNVASADRLAGNPVGYKGPWGTTYAANLRLVAQHIPQDRWVSMLKTAMGGHGQPPMPWMNTRNMSDQDLGAMYTYIRSLGPKGERTPRSLPPGQTPKTPYVDMSTNPGTGR